MVLCCHRPRSIHKLSIENIGAWRLDMKPPAAVQNEDAIAVTGKPYVAYRYVNHADEMLTKP